MTENRESFFARLAQPPFSHRLTRRQLVQIRAMYVLAKYGHRAQKRKACAPGEEPQRYFEHPRAVALIVMDELRIAVALLIMLALGHDCDEDSDQVDWEMLDTLFGEKVSSRLRLLSKRGKTPEEYMDLLWQYGDWITLVAKACDRLHNLRSLPADNEAFCRKQIKETREKYLKLFSHMVEITPPGHQQAVDKLRFLIQKIVVEYEERFRAIDAAAAAAPPTTAP